MTYLRNILAALRRDGLDLDRTENAVLDGTARQTISVRCANAEPAAWARIACALT